MSADKDRSGRTQLHYAAAEANLALVQQLIAQGRDVNEADNENWTPLHFAAQAYSPEVTAVLIQAGAQVDVVDSHGNTPLSRAVFNSRGKGEVIEILRRAGADPFKKNDYGVSPVELARRIGNYDVARFFADLQIEGEAAV